MDGRSFSRVQLGIVDSAFLRVFSFPLVAGAVGDQLRSVYSIITEKLAGKIYGTTDAADRRVVFDRADPFTFTGVMKDLPGKHNSLSTIGGLMSI